jgi:hypothetical protein
MSLDHAIRAWTCNVKLVRLKSPDSRVEKKLSATVMVFTRDPIADRMAVARIATQGFGGAASPNQFNHLRAKSRRKVSPLLGHGVHLCKRLQLIHQTELILVPIPRAVERRRMWHGKTARVKIG